MPDPTPPPLSPACNTQFEIVNRALRVISACTQAVIRATDEPSLLQTLCQLITEEAAYHMAWVGYVCHDEAQSVHPVAWAGHEVDYLKTVNITWADTEQGQSPTGSAIRTCRPIACQDMLHDPNYAPWREAAHQRGYQSSLVLPLLDGEEVFGALNIYSAEADAFDPDELTLLTELADSLSFGIVALRERQKRQQAERALRLSEDKFSKAFYSSPIANCIISFEESHILDVNHGFEWLFGYDREEVVGRTTMELNLWQNPTEREAVLATLRSQSNLKEYEVGLKTRTGQPILCRVSAELFQVDTGLYALVAIADITEHKQTESIILQVNEELEHRVTERTAELMTATQQLQQLNQDLQRSNQELEQFAYVASHDLQEPLRAITSYTQLLISEYDDRFDDTAHEYAGYVIDGAKRMQQLIQDLLSYSRVGTRGKAFIRISSEDVVRKALRNLQIAIAETQAEITVSPLPPVIADPSKLVQVFQNLISNSLKFCNQDHPCIQIHATQRETDVLFQVSDNGIGMKSQYLDRIFDVFKRLHTRREYPGTGIGLAICKKIVMQHGGTIWAESTLDMGTTFFFTILSYSGSLSNEVHPDPQKSC